MANELQDIRIAFIVSNEGIEQGELTEPWRAVSEAGGQPVLIAPEAGQAQAFHHLDKGDTFEVDQTTGRAQSSDFGGVVIPGGVANADFLRGDQAAVRFVQEIFQAGRPAGVICHGPWLLVEADLVRGRTLTSWPTLQTDIRNAGGMWVDEEVQVCTGGPNELISSRKPDDLPAFCREIIRAFASAKSDLARTR